MSFFSPLKSQIRVVLGQHSFNTTSPNTRTFGVEDYIFPRHFSVFNPTLHDIGNYLTHTHTHTHTCQWLTLTGRPLVPVQKHTNPLKNPVCMHSCASLNSCVPLHPRNKNTHKHRCTHICILTVGCGIFPRRSQPLASYLCFISFPVS